MTADYRASAEASEIGIVVTAWKDGRELHRFRLPLGLVPAECFDEDGALRFDVEVWSEPPRALEG